MTCAGRARPAARAAGHGRHAPAARPLQAGSIPAEFSSPFPLAIRISDHDNLSQIECNGDVTFSIGDMAQLAGPDLRRLPVSVGTPAVTDGEATHRSDRNISARISQVMHPVDAAST